MTYWLTFNLFQKKRIFRKKRKKPFFFQAVEKNRSVLCDHMDIHADICVGVRVVLSVPPTGRPGRSKRMMKCIIFMKLSVDKVKMKQSLHKSKD